MQGISLRDDCGLWWPDYDHDPVKCLSFVMRGLKDSDITARYSKHHRTVVQAGGHVGLWPMRLAQTYAKVLTFECEPLLAECIRRNAAQYANIVVHGKALGATVETVKMRGHVSAGSWNIHPNGKHVAEQTTIDALGLDDCDAIILDVEGYEVQALTGARETITRCSPVLHVEELPRAAQGIHEFMRGIGYRLRAKVHADCIYTKGN